MTFQLPAVVAGCRRPAIVRLMVSLLLICPGMLWGPASESASAAPLAQAHLLGRLSSTAPVRLTLTLPLRDPAGLDTLLHRLTDRNDPLYGHYLTPAEFTARFGPTPADYQAVADYVRSQGLTVVATHPNRVLLDVSGPAGAVEGAFAVQLQQYQAADGRVFHIPDADPQLPAAIASRLAGVVGLDTSPVRRPHLLKAAPRADPFAPPIQGPGTGPQGGLTPSDIKTACGLNSVTLDGTGQTLAVFELDGYTQSDVRAYESEFGLPRLPLTSVLVDGVTGAPSTGANSGADEVTLDVELVAALAPRVNRVLVYEGPNSDAGILDTYNKIANDDLAKEISTSWGLPEDQNSVSFMNSENTLFQQMAAQGQTVFAAAGDNGAYDDGTTLSVDDPGSQPYVTSIGGTTLTTHGPGETYSSETTWNAGSVAGGAGGGGISSQWPIPSYQAQSGVITPESLGSTTHRNVPDVSLNADPNVGYSIYYQGGWVVYGGASTATPLWAGFAALVNQQRFAAGEGSLGQANPAIYSAALGPNYARDFHDIADGSTNLYYPAVQGYDLATGWGSPQGANLLADLSGTTPAAAFSAPVTYPAGFNLFSLPDTYSGVGLDSLFGASYPYFVWSATGYRTLTSPQVQAGQGYWVNLPQATTIANSGTPVQAVAPVTISLAAGWNQIGDPFPTQVAIADLQVISNNLAYSFTAASGGTPLISSVLYRYTTATGQYAVVSSSGALTPGTGYFIYATTPVTLQVPPP